ncbi:MAG: ABC transporter ATP-binding protein/permease [Clostridia bacterium]|nr:ABC transporter ATP-binding protein/permease [Clostridia bacterium]
MLELKSIKKEYSAGDTKVFALRGVDLQFRDCEFVSILGPSGCGKTTMLNIIGGLDRYTSGDLFINGKSTKDFNARDWDTYRNHSIGFVFQSYNLIPHQSVLQNVEIALSLSGVSKRERRRRAKEALEKVGLADHIKKKPGEMSGGQMQRVAIARAIVNNPDIILADEPTGALDTETSVQVMDILKEIAKDRLVIMVTHNPELAETYSTRIIKMVDGTILGDTMPLTEEELETERNKEKALADKKKIKMPSLSFSTSFVLSLKNLISKKGRTILTSFAGSIGIIGIALIYAVSNGMTAYINTVQEETLSSYPLTIQAQHLDMSTLLTTFMGQAESIEEHDKDAVYQKAMLAALINAINNTETTENDLKAFKEFIENEISENSDNEKLKEALNGIQYTYNLNLLVYTKDETGKIIHSDTQALLSQLLLENFGMDMSAMMGGGLMGSSMFGSMSMTPASTMWQEMLPGEKGKLVNELVEKQYELAYGTWPTEYNEIVLVLDENNELDDMTLYALGLITKDEMETIFDAVKNGTELELPGNRWSYEEICNMEFRTVLNSSCYTIDKNSGVYTDLRDTDAGMRYLYDNGIPLKVSGIVRPNEDSVSAMLTGAICYTSKLTEYIIDKGVNSEAVQLQISMPDTDIFTGLPFKDASEDISAEEKEAAFRAHIETLTEAEKAKAYITIMSIPSETEIALTVNTMLESMTMEEMRENLIKGLAQQMGMSEEGVADYIDVMSDEEIREIFFSLLAEQFTAQYAAKVQAQLAGMEASQLAAMLDDALPAYTTEQCAVFYEAVLEFSDSDYETNLSKLGYVDIETPSSVNLFASSFENKDVIEEAIAEYNKSVDELKQIAYTDYVGLMMSSITTIINAITYVLIAFVAVSLIVSSIMIGVITLISVQERTKEIGILRALGASKRNISTMFNAETVIIGLASGLVGVTVTYLLCIPINMILHYLTGIGNLSAVLPVVAAVILVAISVVLTMFSGIIPAISAARKDPVVALRTE